ncbi:MAG: HD domain-containing protein [Candidatus Bathyarchaeia archaeon]|nr:HD domain-containing protein [Candidatus Bathyarchaeota archaeon]
MSKKEFEFNEIYKGYIIPLRGEGGNPQYVKTITKEESDATFKAFVKALKISLEKFLKLKNIEKLANRNDVSEFLDFFVLSIKNSLYLDIVPEVIPSFTKGFPYMVLLDPSLKLYRRKGVEKYKAEVLGKIVDEEDFRKAIEKAFNYPADTRIGANVSSLILHSLTVSAIATSLFIESCLTINEKIDFGKLTALRVASLFHDVGKYKFEEWHSHEKISLEVLKDLKEHYATDEAIKIIDLASSIILGKEAELQSIYKEADEISSAIDRTKKLVLKVLDKEDIEEFEKAAERIGKKFEFQSLYMDWEFWKELGEENIKRMSEKFCRRLSKIDIENPLFRETLEELEESVKPISDEVLVVRADVRRIQEYIFANDLRTMKGASILIDLIVMTSIPQYLHDELQLPYECILYYGGGNTTFIIPKTLEERLKKEFSDVFQKEFNVSIVYGCAPLYDNFNLTNAIIDREIAKKKFIPELKEDVIPNIFRVCSYCGFKFADQREGYICSLCKEKYEVGNVYHFRRIIEKLAIVKDEEKKEFLSKMLEYIGGLSRSLEELKNPKEYLNIAMLRIDANLTGQLMSSSISITDASERSIRIDSSLKRAFHSFLNEVKSKNSDDYNRVVLGVLYMGGDDCALIVPSKLALGLAYWLVNEYFLNMGCKSTLSVGIAISKPKHPITLLYESSGCLLNEVTKSKVREKALLVHKEEAQPREDFRGAVSLFVMEQGTINPENIKYALNYAYEKAVSMAFSYREEGTPIIIAEKAKENSILRYFELIFNKNFDKIESATPLLILQEIYQNEALIDQLKNLRYILLKNLHVKVENNSSFFVKVMFAGKEAGGEENKGVYGALLKNLLYLKQKIFALYDLYMLLESFLGGIKS